MKKLIFLLTITVSLFAQYEWSDPVQLSEQGIYPSSTYTRPAITVDNNGDIHSFWIKGIQVGSDLRWYSQIEYRKSTDNGISWSATENLTSDYLTERIYVVKAICDSQNNIHLVYSRTVEGSSYSQLLHKKYNGIYWSDLIEIYQYYTSALRIGIDKMDRLYALWYLGPATTGTEYYSYCDAITDSVVWKEAVAIDSTGSYGVLSQLIFDDENNLFSVGSFYNEDMFPYFFEFDRDTEEWKHEQICDSSALACALVISDNEELYANISIGSSNSDNSNYMLFKLKSDTLWSDIEYINSDRDFSERYMYVDNDDNFHLFDYDYNDEDYGGISYSFYNHSNQIWDQELIQQGDSIYYISTQSVSFDMKDAFFTTYLKGNRDTLGSSVYFQTKTINVGIEYNEQFTIDNCILHQNYPNPFNPITSIQFSIADQQDVNLSIYNYKGELVNKLIDSRMNKGIHRISFNAKNINSGIYFYTLKTEESEISKKMLLLK